MVRVIPIGHGLVYQFHGLCHKISPQLCMDVHAITAHCTTYNNLLMPLTIAIFLWLCVPVFPAYCISLYFRCPNNAEIEGNLCLSSGTIKAQRNLVKALTIQAILPLCMMGQATIYLWRQFQLPYANYAPYFEEWVFLSLAMVSLVSPCITIYYVLPYRKRVTSIFNAFYYQRGKFRIGGGDIMTATTETSYRISTHRTRSYF
ncbi:unnamed protein product, partial [Mesorhabditis spiculigera]